MTPANPRLWDTLTVSRGWLPLPLRWVSLTLLAFPLLWAAGVDGFLWAILLPVILLGLFALRSGRMLVNELTLAGVLLFVAAFLVSGASIREPDRFLTWIRDGSVLAMMIGTAALVARSDRSAVIPALVLPVCLVMIFAALLGFAGIALGTDLSLTTPMAYLLPSNIVATEFGERLVVKTLFSEAWFAGITYPRLKSVFTYATAYAVAIAAFVAYVVASGVYRRNRLVQVALVLSLLALVLTTARAALLGLSAGLFAWALLSSNRWLRSLAVGAALAVLALIVVFFDQIRDLVQLASTLRGEGSLNARMMIYRQTIEWIGINPLGYGTQRDVPDLVLPLGSHSTWLALPFKYGIAGLTGLVMAGVGLLWQGRGARLAFSTTTLVLIVTLATVGLFEEVFLDATTALIIAVLFGASLAAPGRVPLGAAPRPAPSRPPREALVD